ncbi:MAG TPA: YitT family protein [Candidatus Marinimicrobia bacterium]|nr:YitT family protein [Candidatus Neomarinimicrobiota bacterium]
MTERELNLKRNVVDYVIITLGSAVMAFSLVVFLIPNKVTAGGVSGMATILYHLFKIPAGISMLAMNVPLFLIGVKVFGKKFGAKTLWGVFTISFFTDGMDKYLGWGALTTDHILASLYGGVILGVGLGIIMRGRGTTGGSDIVARILHKYTNLSLGWSFIVIDTGVIIATGAIFQNVDLILFGLISLGISSKIVDVVTEGVASEKGVIIISEKWQAISQRILSEMNRGVTGLDSVGMFTNTEKKSLYCVISTRQVEQIRRIIKEEDTNAFVTVQNIAILQGEGFRARTTLMEE